MYTRSRRVALLIVSAVLVVHLVFFVPTLYAREQGFFDRTIDAVSTGLFCNIKRIFGFSCPIDESTEEPSTSNTAVPGRSGSKDGEGASDDGMKEEDTTPPESEGEEDGEPGKEPEPEPQSVQNVYYTGPRTVVNPVTERILTISGVSRELLDDELDEVYRILYANNENVYDSIDVPDAVEDFGDISGTLSATRGGTGLTSFTAGDLMYASGASELAKLSVGANGEVLTVVGGVPAWTAASPGGFTGGELIASHITATSTTATSTFAGNISVATDKHFAINGSPVIGRGSGTDSFFAGLGNTATGTEATAFGINNNAGGSRALVAGYNNSYYYGLSNTDSTILGARNTARDGRSLIAIGSGNTVTADSSTGRSIALGAGNTITANNSIAIGTSHNVTETTALTIGYNNDVTGQRGIVIGADASSEGFHGTVFGSYSTAGADYAQAIGYLNTASAHSSVASGYGNTVRDHGQSWKPSVAMGAWNQVGGNFGSAFIYGSAFGVDNDVLADYGSAFGYKNNASGYLSNAFGYTNTASATGTSAFGSNITNSIANSAMIGPSNTAKLTILSTGEARANFFSATSSNATSTFAGDISIATDRSYRFGDDIFAARAGNDGTGLIPNTSDIPGLIVGTNNTYPQNGRIPVALGIGNYAGTEAFAAGSGNYAGATGGGAKTYAVAVGINNQVDEARSVAMGHNNTVNADSSLAFGADNTNTGNFAASFGYFNTTSGNYGSVSFGYSNTASGNYGASAFGFTNTASGNYSTAFGYTNTASANHASAFGSNITNSIANSAMIGPSNTAKLTILSTGETQAPFFTATSTTATSSIAAALGIGTTTPTAQLHTTGGVRFSNFGAGTLETDAAGNLTVSSDERLKEIEGNFTKSIDAVLGLTPISYRWSKESGLEAKTVYAGFSAQNVQDFIPEAVGEGPDGMLTLSDRPLLAAVVNAVKDIWKKLTGLERRVEALEGEGAPTNTNNTNTSDTFCVEDVCVDGDGFKTLLEAYDIEYIETMEDEDEEDPEDDNTDVEGDVDEENANDDQEQEEDDGAEDQEAGDSNTEEQVDGQGSEEDITDGEGEGGEDEETKDTDDAETNDEDDEVDEEEADDTGTDDEETKSQEEDTDDTGEGDDDGPEIGSETKTE